MKIIVIRKVWQGTGFQKGSIDIIFKNLAMEINDIGQVTDIGTFAIDEYDLIFLHINNTEAEEFFNSLNDKQKNKIILFSTSETIPMSRDYDWCHGYPFMGKMRNWESFENLCWQAIEPGISLQEIIDKLKQKTKVYLIALSVLCQGYLAVKDPTKIKFTNEIDVTKKDIPADWWNPAFGSGDKFDATGISKEFEALGKKAPASITDLFKEKEPTADLVFEAYKSLPEILKS